MSDWQSNPITVDGFEVIVHSSAKGITIGKTIDGIYSSDLLMEPEAGSELSEAVDAAVAYCLAARSAS
jgi:hypothetical protein